MQDIILDVTRILGRGMKGRLPTGVDRVCLAYLEHFADARLFIHIRGNGILLTEADSARLREWLLIPESDRLRILQNLPIQFSSLLRAPLSQPPRDAIFMNLGHSGVEYPRYMNWLKRHGVRPVYMVHDLIPITHPEYCRDGEVERHTLRMLTMLQTAHGIITNSQDTLDALTTFAADHQLALPDTLVAHLGTPPGLTFSQCKRPLAEPYFIMLGTIEPRKNHLLILNIWRKLVERHGPLAPKLVLIGQRGWECEQIIDMLERCPALQGSVIEYPDTSDEMLAAWLHHSEALLFPSFAEGFGLPLLEALQQHVPVIASDLPVFREIVGDFPDYLDAIDGAGWLNTIERYWLRSMEDREERSLSNLPTWEAHFKKVDDWLPGIEKLNT